MTTTTGAQMVAPQQRRRQRWQTTTTTTTTTTTKTTTALENLTQTSPLAILIIVILSLGQRAASTSPAASVTPAANFELGGGGGGGGPQQQQQQQQVSHKSQLNGRQFGDSINDIQIECNSNNIVVTLQTNSGFNGMIYPKGLSKNSTCMTEYHQLASNITYYLPLKSCNTMSTEVEDGVEYFNTVMVQPHRRLVTNQGRGYHIRCRYQTKERTITNQEQQLSVNLTQVTPAVMGSASVPGCTMRIYSTSDLQHEVSAENVRIGDELQLIISLDDQDVYGMLVTNCLVRDGMNWGEQPLIDDHGCPVDEEIMPEFVYAKNLTRASVTFQAHKFPYTSSVYYQCNVRLCFRDAGCQAHVPPNCSGASSASAQASNARQRPGPLPAGAHYKSAPGAEEVEPANGIQLRSTGSPQPQQQATATGNARSKRWVDGGELDGVASDELLKPAGRDMTIEVSSGLHVAERETETAAAASEAEGVADPLMAAATNDDPEVSGVETNDQANGAESAKERRQSEREFCMSLRKFAIIISLISLLLMTAIIILIACLIKRRNRQKLESQLNDTYDHHNQEQHFRDPYGAPYANGGYRHD